MSILYRPVTSTSPDGVFAEYRIHRGSSGNTYTVSGAMKFVPWNFKPNTIPLGRRRADDLVPCVYVSLQDGIYQFRHSGSSETVYQYETPQRILTSNFVISSPVPYVRADGKNAVIWYWDNLINSRRIYETVNTSGNSWSTSIIKATAGKLTGDPAVFVNSAGHNTVIYRLESQQVFQLESMPDGTWGEPIELYDPRDTP
jgi:hypothetical protein